jgi:hypothetical protein
MVRQTCPHCRRPFDDEWVVYCPVTRTLADELRGDGLTTQTPVNIKLLGDDTIVVTEIRTTTGTGALYDKDPLLDDGPGDATG